KDRAAEQREQAVREEERAAAQQREQAVREQERAAAQQREQAVREQERAAAHRREQAVREQERAAREQARTAAQQQERTAARVGTLERKLGALTQLARSSHPKSVTRPAGRLTRDPQPLTVAPATQPPRLMQTSQPRRVEQTSQSPQVELDAERTALASLLTCGPWREGMRASALVTSDAPPGLPPGARRALHALVGVPAP